MKAVLKSGELYRRIAEKVGEDTVSNFCIERVLQSHDAAPLPKIMEVAFRMTPDVVVMPKSVEEVQKIMKLAYELEIPVTPRGGSSWGLGGCVPVMGGILLNLSLLNKSTVDVENSCVYAEAGATWQNVADKALAKGLSTGTLPSSALGATIGGWCNTGGVGIGTYKYGGAYEQIRGLEVVLPNGKVINTGSRYTLSNGGGYNLNGLFIGSEGTLGVITKATIKLHPKPEMQKPVSFAFPDFDSMAKAMQALTRTDLKPMHIGYVDQKHLENVTKLGVDVPVHGGHLNLMYEGTEKEVAYHIARTVKLMKKYLGEQLPDKLTQHEWTERAYEFRVKRLGPSFITASAFVPINNFQEMYRRTEELGKKMKVNLGYIGSLADNNTVDFLPYFLTDERRRSFIFSAAFAKKLADLAMSLDGRPVGLGLWMASNLPKLAGESAFTMRDIKNALDPNDIMNPGKLVEIGTKWGFPVPAWAMNVGMNVMAFMKRFLPRDRIQPLKGKKRKVGVSSKAKASKH